MTTHDHSQYVDGCYRCEIGVDEYLLADVLRERDKAVHGDVSAAKIRREEIVWLRQHRKELLAALGMVKVMDYDSATDSPPRYGDRRWATYGTWLYPGDEIWEYET